MWARGRSLGIWFLLVLLELYLNITIRCLELVNTTMVEILTILRGGARLPLYVSMFCKFGPNHCRLAHVKFGSCEAATGVAKHTIPCLSKRRESSSMIDFLDQRPSLDKSHLDQT